MVTFPLLKSGQEAQYPVCRTVKQNVETVSFLDGSEQRCATAGTLREWTIQLHLIDEQELRNLELFFEQLQGQAGQFTFIDPLDGVQYNNCSLVNGSLSELFQGPGRVSATLVIRENPN
jgi:phage-related protein